MYIKQESNLWILSIVYLGLQAAWQRGLGTLLLFFSILITPLASELSGLGVKALPCVCKASLLLLSCIYERRKWLLYYQIQRSGGWFAYTYPKIFGYWCGTFKKWSTFLVALQQLRLGKVTEEKLFIRNRSFLNRMQMNIL